VKVKVCVHAMKIYKGSSGVTPLIHNVCPGWREVVCLKPQLLFRLGNSPWYTLNRRHRIEALIFKITEAHTYATAMSSEIPINDNISNNYPGFEVTNCSRGTPVRGHFEIDIS